MLARAPRVQRRPIDRRPQGVSVPLAPPIGGWNARDALDGMKPTDAVILENWFPRTADVAVRKGYILQCNTGEGAFAVQTLAEWKNATGRKLIAGCHGKLIDVSSSSPSTIGSGFTVNAWRWKVFAGRLFLVNGTDAPQDYDGTTRTATAWSGSGLTISNLKDVAAYKERLFFIEKNTLNFWYAGLRSITGVLTKFDLSYTGSFGGTLQAIGIITSDGGIGQDDLLAFFLSSGEVIIYRGSDPGNASDWSRVGVFFVGAPVGAVATQYGSDVIAITRDGFLPLTQVLPFGRSQGTKLTLSDKISGAVSEAITSYAGNAGWQSIVYPKGDQLIFNIPRSATVFDQYVMNLVTRAWCKFTGIASASWGLFNDHLYFGGVDGKVYKADSGNSDNGSAIVADGQTAWNFFRHPGQLKNFTMARIIFGAVSDPGAQMAVGVDFDISIPTATVATAAVQAGAIWDQGIWDQAIWGGAQQTVKGWQAITGLGYAASLRLRASVTSQDLSWRSSNIIYKPGGMV